MRSLVVKTPAAAETISVAALRAHSRLDDYGDDADLGRIITAARMWAEKFTGRTFVKTVYTLTLDAWPSLGPVRLPGAPIISVDAIRTMSATYTPTVYAPENYVLKGRDVIALNDWPEPGVTYGGIEIDFAAGYGVDATAVPGDIALAVLKAAAFQNENREAQMQDSGAGQLLSAYKLFEVT